MILQRTDYTDPAFVTLVAALDAELAIIDGEDHAFYHQYNGIDRLKYVVVAYVDDVPVGCGAIKPLDAESMEVKRMFVAPGRRGQGVATAVLLELEKWAFELGFHCCVLETGKRQVDAVALYRKNGYVVIPNYGQYAGVENSVCFAKNL